MSNGLPMPGFRRARRVLDRIGEIDDAAQQGGAPEEGESVGSNKSSGSGRPRKAWGKRVCFLLAVTVLLVTTVWAGPQVVALVHDADVAAGSSQVVTSVSDAAQRAAAHDAETGSDVQYAHLEPHTFDEVTVQHVVDGDTLAVVLADGEQVSVRLVGIDSPESVAPQNERNCPEGIQASDHMKSLVEEGDTLWLQHDTSETDKYNRLLAYVWLACPANVDEADDPAFIAQYMLNAIQVVDGYAQPKTYRPDTYHDGLFATWGDEAVADGRGVTSKWA